MKLVFDVPSRKQALRYRVRVSDDSGAVRMTCDCPAGRTSGALCHHRLKVATGDMTDVQAAERNFRLLPELLAKAGWSADAIELDTIEGRLEELQARADALRKKLATEMNGFEPGPKPKRAKPGEGKIALAMPDGSVQEVTRAEAERITLEWLNSRKSGPDM